MKHTQKITYPKEMIDIEKEQAAKRVGCLYRVSTQKQVNLEDDIPMQRNACMEYIKKKDGWKLVREYIEPGVSGYHKGLNDRKVLKEVIKDVGNKQIDVLLVFMFDRIGRKDNETPFLLKRIVECGVEVWSVCEGQQTFENSSDNLMNIIRFWGANTESQKTAARVDSGRNYATKKGQFTGGIVAYGYQLVPTGKLDRKNRMINEFIKEPFESGIVEDIYDKLIDENMSLYAIAAYLNEDRQLRTRKGNLWSTSTIRNMIKNPLYKGYMSYGKTRMKEVERTSFSEITKETFLDVAKRPRAVPKEEWVLSQNVNPDYVIVNEKRWQLAQEILEKRCKKYTSNLHPSVDKTWKSSLLLTGLMECGYCHGKLSPAAASQKIQKADGSITRHHTEFYKCNTRGRGKNFCPAKSYLSRLRLEKSVIEEVNIFLSSLEQIDYSSKMANHQEKLLKESETETERLLSLQKESQKVQAHMEKFKQELYKSIVGESSFDGKYINECLKTAETKKTEITQEIERLKKRIQQKHLAADECPGTKETLPFLQKIFEKAPLNIKKKILSILIKRIVVTEKEIDIYFNLTPNSFLHIAQKTI